MATLTKEKEEQFIRVFQAFHALVQVKNTGTKKAYDTQYEEFKRIVNLSNKKDSKKEVQ